MNTDLHKRLEEAAKTNLDIFQDLFEEHIKKNYVSGYKFGMKEAVMYAKEWIAENIGEYIDGFIAINRALADFETDMNKLLEEN